MAEFWRLNLLSTDKMLSNRKAKLNVLELGSGCGLGGIAAGMYASSILGSVTFTDCNAEVLARLRDNLRLNFIDDLFNESLDSSPKVHVEYLDFLNYDDLNQLPSIPDIIIASGW